MKKKNLSFVDNIQELRTIPAVVMEIINLLNTAPPPKPIIIKKLNEDTALAAFVLKFCNSPLFEHRVPINSIEHSINYIGIPSYKSILMSYFMRNLYSKSGTKYINNYLWEHSLQVALFARHLAIKLNLEDIAEDAYIAGLLHDIGKLVIYLHVPDRYEELIKRADIETTSLISLELKELEYSHQETGYHIMKNWRFSGMLIDTALYHHDFSKYKGKDSVVALATFANQTVHYALDKLHALPSEFLKVFGLTETHYNRIVEEIAPMASGIWGFRID